LRFIFNSENIISELDRELSIEPADLVIVDAYSDVFDGKEQNNAAQTRAFVNKFKVLAEKHQCLFLFLHHTGKRTEDLTPSKNNFVGSQSLEASVRLGIELRVDRVNHELRHFCIVKGNYLGSQYKQASFVLKMDENFVFSETGDRTSFDNLALNPNQGKQSSKGKQPSDFTPEQHLAFLRESASTPKSKNQLTNAIMDNFELSDKPARKFIDYYIEEEYLKVLESKPYSTYQINEGELPF
ncbi:MAG: AAA family ATPase, partial [Bacteroidaceae bacterium]